MTTWRGLGEAIHAHPRGESTLARMAMTASRVGFDGVVVRDGRVVPEAPATEDIEDHFDIELHHGIELDGDDPETISGRLPHLREQTAVLMVPGGSERMNRFVSSQRHIDVLTRPITPDGPDLDRGIASHATDNDVAIELDLRPLRTAGGTRVRYVDRLRRLWRLVDHYELEYVVTMAPTTHLEVVGPRELVALGDLVGIDPEAVREGLATWLSIAQGNRDLAGEGFFG